MVPNSIAEIGRWSVAGMQHARADLSLTCGFGLERYALSLDGYADFLDVEPDRLEGFAFWCFSQPGAEAGFRKPQFLREQQPRF
jgi:hypothetical protein